jgi:hypothetical protein
MAIFRVTQEFPFLGDPPTQATTDRMRGRFRDAVPGAGIAVEVGIGRIQVEMTLEAESEEGALAVARTTADSVLGSGPARVDIARTDSATHC